MPDNQPDSLTSWKFMQKMNRSFYSLAQILIYTLHMTSVCLSSFHQKKKKGSLKIEMNKPLSFQFLNYLK